jgi:hypothetical protein
MRYGATVVEMRLWCIGTYLSDFLLQENTCNSAAVTREQRVQRRVPFKVAIQHIEQAVILVHRIADSPDLARKDLTSQKGVSISQSHEQHTRDIFVMHIQSNED